MNCEDSQICEALKNFLLELTKVDKSSSKAKSSLEGHSGGLFEDTFFFIPKEVVLYVCRFEQQGISRRNTVAP